MFDAPKEKIIQWIRTRLVELAVTSKADKVRVECFKALLNDLRGIEEHSNIRIDLVLHK